MLSSLGEPTERFVQALAVALEQEIPELRSRRKRKLDKGGAVPEVRFGALLVSREGDANYPRTLHLKLFCDGGELYLDLRLRAEARGDHRKGSRVSACGVAGAVGAARSVGVTLLPFEVDWAERIGRALVPRGALGGIADGVDIGARYAEECAISPVVRGLRLPCVLVADVAGAAVDARAAAHGFGGVDGETQVAVLERLLKHRVYTVRMAALFLKLAVCGMVLGDEPTLAADRRLQADVAASS